MLPSCRRRMVAPPPPTHVRAVPQIDLQTGLVSTIAGDAAAGFEHGDATRQARFRFPQKLALDGEGQRLFISDLNDTIRVMNLGTCVHAVAAAEVEVIHRQMSCSVVV